MRTTLRLLVCLILLVLGCNDDLTEDGDTDSQSTDTQTDNATDSFSTDDTATTTDQDTDSQTDSGMDTDTNPPDLLCSNGCLIDSICYPNQVTNPLNPCQQCNVLLSTVLWSNRDNGECDDGMFCTANDICTEGVCNGEIRSCSDEIACNGTETCDEENDRCISGESTCAEDELCDATQDQCVQNCTGCTIESICYGNGQTNPVNPCERCNIEESSTTWSYGNGVPCDDGLFCTVNDTCQQGSCNGETRQCSDQVECNGTETCDEENNTCQSGISICEEYEVCSIVLDECLELARCVWNPDILPVTIKGSKFGTGAFAFHKNCDLVLVHASPKDVVRLSSIDGTSTVVASNVGTGSYLLSLIYREQDGLMYVGDNSGNIYSVSDLGDVTWITTISGASISAMATAPEAFGIDHELIVIAQSNAVISVLDLSGPTVTPIGTSEGTFSNMAFAPDGTLYIANNAGLIQTMSSDGDFSTFASELSAPDGIIVAPDNTGLYVAAASTDMLLHISIPDAEITELESYNFDSGWLPSPFLFDDNGLLLLGTGENEMNVNAYTPQ